ncbi:MAG: substrate-binding domain-containing protein [Cellulosilyticum sp.]|nr:substrate-binding domain-containing protein [Cellulosilyticum sp.]
MIIGLGLVGLVGCAKNNVNSNEQIKILLTLVEGDTFRNTLVDKVVQIAEEEGVYIEVYDEHGSLEQQVEHIKMAVEKEYDAIICSPINADIVLELEALAGDLPIVYFNNCPDEKWLKPGQYMYVGSDEQYAGQYQAEYILEQFQEQSELNVVILKGEKGHIATNGRTDELKYTLNASDKNIHYVFEDYAYWSQDEAYDLFKMFLKTKQPFDVVACNNDAMALGVIEVCKEQGIKDVMVIGVDATADGCEAIEKGDMAFTVYQSATGQGEYAIKTAIRLAKGQSIADLEYLSEDGKHVWVPFERVDASNVATYK